MYPTFRCGEIPNVPRLGQATSTSGALKFLPRQVSQISLYTTDPLPKQQINVTKGCRPDPRSCLQDSLNFRQTGFCSVFVDVLNVRTILPGGLEAAAA